jgi:hypothetical protein
MSHRGFCGVCSTTLEPWGKNIYILCMYCTERVIVELHQLGFLITTHKDQYLSQQMKKTFIRILQNEFNRLQFRQNLNPLNGFTFF